MEDSDIIELYFERNETAISETDKKYGKRLIRLSENITGNISDAEECVNDTYLTTWNKIPPTRPNHFYAFLCKIARFLSLDIYDKGKAAKRSATVVELTAEMYEMLPDKSLGEGILPNAETLGGRIDAFLRTLDEGTRSIFVCRYFYSEAVKDIAKSTGMTQNRISGILFRTRKQLKEYLEKTGGVDL